MLRGGHFKLFHVTHSLYVFWFLVGRVARAGLHLVGGRAAARVRGRTDRAPPEASAADPDALDSRVLRSGVTRLTLEKPEGFAAHAGDFVFRAYPEHCRARVASLHDQQRAGATALDAARSRPRRLDESSAELGGRASSRGHERTRAGLSSTALTAHRAPRS